MKKIVAGFSNPVYFCGEEKNNYFMTKNYTLQFDWPENLDQSLHISNLISINLNVSMMDFVSTNSRPSLFEGCGGINLSSYWPKIEVAHDTTWDDFGRAYYDSRDFQFTEFHVTLCSVDELRQKIEAKMHEFEQNSILSDLYFLAEPVSPSIYERCFVGIHWNEDLHAWIEDFRAKNIITANIWETDDHHSCHPYDDTYFYQHQLAKLSLSVQNAQTSAASRPCCRSFLMASCRQLSGDDLLSH